MDIKDLKKVVKNSKVKEFNIMLYGLIETKIIMQEVKIITSKDKLIIKGRLNQKVSINKHQIMNIIQEVNNIIKIKLDQLLEIHIIQNKDIN